MAEPDDERDKKPEDLFTDLDKFFAPVEDDDWPEEEGAEEAETAQKASEEGDLEDWTVPKIDIPAEEELLGGEETPPPPTVEAAPGSPAIAGDEDGAEAPVVIPEAGQEPPLASETAADEPRVEAAPAERQEMQEPTVGREPAEETAEPTDEWLPEPTGEMSGEEWERFRQALEEEVRIDEPAADEAARESVQPGPGEYPLTSEPQEEIRVGEEVPEAEEVEAAAEHFAETIRQTPEDVERELLADLEEP